MIDLEIPESVADLIDGRVLKRMGAKHHVTLATQANFDKDLQNMFKV